MDDVERPPPHPKPLSQRRALPGTAPCSPPYLAHPSGQPKQSPGKSSQACPPCRGAEPSPGVVSISVPSRAVTPLPPQHRRHRAALGGAARRRRPVTAGDRDRADGPAPAAEPRCLRCQQEPAPFLGCPGISAAPTKTCPIPTSPIPPPRSQDSSRRPAPPARRPGGRRGSRRALSATQPHCVPSRGTHRSCGAA